jgi:hypothetical protein
VAFHAEQIGPDALQQAVRAAGYDLLLTDGLDTAEAADERQAKLLATHRRDLIAAALFTLPWWWWAWPS